MSVYRPPNKKNTYHKIGIKNSAGSGGKQGSKYNMPKKQKLPTAVVVTNILMICVILAVCGVVFAISFNNAKYNEADASKAAERSKAAAALTSTQSSETQSSEPQNSGTQSSKQQSSMAESSAAVSSETVSSAAQVAASGTENSESTPDEPNESDKYDKEFFKDDLFIGDSIFTGLYGYSYIDRANVAASVGYTPYGAQENPFDDTFYSGSAVDYAKDKQPKHIIIMLGSNGLSGSTDFDDFANGYKGLLNSLKTGCPDAEIIAVSVPPIAADTEYTHLTNAIIDTANERIKSLCSELGVTYYDFNNTVLKDGSGYFKEEYAELDGLHFKGATYPILLSNVEKLLKSE